MTEEAMKSEEAGIVSVMDMHYQYLSQSGTMDYRTKFQFKRAYGKVWIFQIVF